MSISRRAFVAAGFAAATLGGCALRPPPRARHWSLSLAQWSLHRRHQSGGMSTLDFPRVAAREFDFRAVEYVNQFFKDKVDDEAYLAELKRRCEAEGVRSVLIMCDGEGALGDPDPDRRTRAVRNHARWARAAAALGCHSIRVNAESAGSRGEQARLAADGVQRLAEECLRAGVGCLLENHGGLSSHADWLLEVVRLADHPSIGTLPDFGNWYEYDRYEGVAEMMPLARAVSVKSTRFDGTGDETTIDYEKMLDIVLNSRYRGWLGIEYEGDQLSEADGIRATRALVERVLAV